MVREGGPCDCVRWEVAADINFIVQVPLELLVKRFGNREASLLLSGTRPHNKVHLQVFTVLLRL